MTDLSFAGAETLLAKSGLHWEPAPLTPPTFRWSGPGARVAEYHTRPESFVKVIVYAFVTEKDASAAMPEIEKWVLDGTRSRYVRRGALVFLVQGPVVFPNPELSRSTNQTFDAVVAAISG